MDRVLRLKRRQQFSRVFQKGHTYGDRNLVLFVLPEPGLAIHVGFAVQRTVGSAVKKNRVRRRVRALVASLEPELVPCGDMVWLGKSGALTASWPDLVRSGRKLLRQAGCLARRTTEKR